MQNTWHRGLALGNAPDARILRWRYQHVGIFWPYLTLKFALAHDAKLKICVSPHANPRRQSVEYRWRWVFWRLMYISCIFHVVCASFSALATNSHLFFGCFSTGLVRLYIAGLLLRSCRTIGAPFVQGSAQCVFFSFLAVAGFKPTSW